MSLSRAPYHHGDLRNALVASAVRLIEQDGPAAFSLREAARDVGVSANAAYRHFADKSALMTAVSAAGLAQLSHRMQTAMERASASATRSGAAIARFMAVGRAYVEFAADHPQLFRLMFGASGVGCVSPDATGATTAREATLPTPYDVLGRSLDALVTDGALPPGRRPGAELKAWVVVHGFASLALDGGAGIPAGRDRGAALESVLAFAVLGLCGELPPPPRKGRGEPRGITR